MATQSKFLDTYGFYSWLSSDAPAHDAMVSLFRAGEDVCVTTDWIVGETCNLLVARRHPQLVRKVFRLLDQTAAIDMLTVGEERFRKARLLFEKFEEHAFPLTDCTSFVVMQELRLTEALTADRHFRVMGFNPLLESA